MENKIIIIDGTDVSGCKNALQGKHTILCAGSEDSSLCDANKNCLYKKYKRKEQECARLKEEIEKLKGTNGAIHPNSAYYKISKLKCKNNELERQHYDLCILKTKYKQTLQEIKEIAEGMHDLWINKTTYTDMDNLVKHLLECELNRIRYKLDEISECEVENDNK